MASPKLTELRFDDDEYFSGFGHRRLETAEARGLYVEWYTAADGTETVTLCRPAAMRQAFQRSRRAGGGALGLSTEFLLDSDPRVVLSGRDARGLTVAAALDLLRSAS